MIRTQMAWYMALIVAACCWIQPPTAYAQLDFLKSLFRPQPQQRFAGHQQLNDAIQQAERGELAKSLSSARDAFKSGGAKQPFDDPDSPTIAPNLVRLSRLWQEKNAPPHEVAEILRDVVLPKQIVDVVLPYATQWQGSYDVLMLSRPNARLLAMESVAAELIRWTVLAKQSQALHAQLDSRLASSQSGWLARVVAVQLAVAENDSRAANLHLEKLVQDTNQISGAPQFELLCHAVMAASRDPKSEAAGLRLLEAILARAQTTLPQNSGLKSNAQWLEIHAARQHVRAGRLPDAARLVKHSVANPINDQRFGSDYVLYLRNLQIQQAAVVLLEGGFVAEALEILGPICEQPEPRSLVYYDRFNIAAMLGRELQKLPAEARLELLRKWVIPHGERTALRDLSDFVPVDHTARVLSPQASRLSYGHGLLQDTYSTSWHLLATAKELGKLDPLLQDLGALPPQTPRVEELQLLGAILRDGSADAKSVPVNQTTAITARLQDLLEVTIQNLPQPGDGSTSSFPIVTFVVATEAARHPEWRDVTRLLLERLIEHTQRIQWDRPRAHIRMTLLEVMRLRGHGNSPIPSLDEWRKLQPPHWVEAGIQTAAQHASGSLPGVWFALDGCVQHLTGAYDSEISFEYPLAGRFEITFDCREGGWAEGNAGYGGAMFAINAYSDAGYLFSKGRSGFNNGPSLTNLLHKTPWNRYTIQVDGDVVRYLANGQLVHEDRPGTSAPWLTFGADWGRTPIFRNIKLLGTPTIPGEVLLLANGQLRGWITSHYDESRRDSLRGPRRYVPTVVKQNGQEITMLVEADETNMDQSIAAAEAETDWMFQNGELTSSRREPFWPGTSESWIYYQRPLRDGDTLRYEFFHQSGRTAAAPTIGRIAYVFGSDGITRHGLTDGPYDVFANRADNGVLEKKKLMLKENEWNTVEVVLRGEQLSISLNGEPATMEKLSANDGRLFGFYHDAARSNLRVRNVVLTGKWPREFNNKHRSAIEWPEATAPLPNSRFLGYAISEERISDNAYEVYRRALTLDVKSRYEFLHQWVMPNSSHDLLRMSGAFTPTHPAPSLISKNPIDVATAAARQTIDQRLVQTGGNFVCPAILLVLAAFETNRLDELKQEVLKHPPTSSTEMARNRAAILGIIALLQNHPEEAAAALWECTTLITPADKPAQYSRWGDVALASLAIQHPLTQVPAYELLDRIQRVHLQSGHPGTPEFGRFVRQLHGQVHFLLYGGSPDAFGTQPNTKQWRMVPQPSAKSRGEGHPIASFDSLTGEMAIRGGHDWDLAYFQSPLRGNYEVSCNVSHIGYREMMLMAAGIGNSLKYDHVTARVWHVRTPAVEVPIPQPISPRTANGFNYRVVVRDGHFTSYVNGQRLYETDLPEQPDPWLAVGGLAGHSYRFARNLVINGTPDIPTELDLLATGNLTGWLTDYYGNAVGQSPFKWTLQDGVLTSDQTVIRNAEAGRLKVENIVYYHRPLLDDGEISYEFYYDPATKIPAPQTDRRADLGLNMPQRFVSGKTVVHPALDRLVCMLEPDGVRIHWLTDGRFDRTGLAAGNLSMPRTAPTSNGTTGSTTLPFKTRDWNAVKFATKGDTLTIELNGQPIFTHAIEPTNLRHFGLFHYANESSVRVRNIRYRGDWPKSLPTVDQQELATGPERLAVIPDSQLPDTATFDFTGSKFNTGDFEFHGKGQASATYIRPTAAGLRFALRPGEQKPQFAWLHPKLKLSGDFSLTIEYSGLQTTPAKASWGTGLSFKVLLDKSYETGLEARDAGGNKAMRAMWRLVAPVREYHDESLPGFSESGRMRLVRRGPALYYLIAEKGSEDFRLVAQRPIGTSDVNTINIQADASDAVGGTEFLVQSLSIRAAKILPLK